MTIGQTLFQWIDVLWIPAAIIVVQKEQWAKSVLYVLCGIVMLRLQIELMYSMNMPSGFFPFMDSPLYTRGLIVYSLFNMAFLILAHYSPRVNPFVFMAAGISIFIFAFCTSLAVMLL